MERQAERLTALVAAADRLNRKFEASDVTAYPKLGQLARDWLLSTSQPAEEGFLLDVWMQANQGQMLSLGQLKGVLNTIVARERRAASRQTGYTNAAQMAPQAPGPLAAIKNGRYRVEFEDGRSVAIRITDSEKYAGSRNVTVLVGADDWQWTGTWITADGRRGGSAHANVVDALNILANADDQLVYGKAFARMGNQCYICGRNLDTAESIDAGYGPTCADNYGLPWGQKNTPEAVQAARATTDPLADATAAYAAAVAAWQADEDDDDAFDAMVAARKALRALRPSAAPVAAAAAVAAVQATAATAQEAVIAARPTARAIACQNGDCGLFGRTQYLTDPRQGLFCAICDEPAAFTPEED
jgi:hypothetical protein